MVALTGVIDNHPEGVDTEYQRHNLELEKFANDFLIFSPKGEPPQLVTGPSTSNSPSSSMLTTPRKEPAVQPIDGLAYQAPIPLPFSVFMRPVALIHHDYTLTPFPFSVAPPISPLVPGGPVPEPALDALFATAITEDLLNSSTPPRLPTPIPEVWAPVPKKTRVANRKRHRDTTPDSQETPLLACENSH